MNKKLLLSIYLIFFFAQNTFLTNASAQVTTEEALNQVIKGFGKGLENIETATKGAELKNFFLNNNLKLSFNGSTREYKFVEKKYKVLENSQLIETGKWKISGLFKNQIKLKPDGKSKPYYLKKINKKNVIYHFDKFPGSEGTKRTLVNIENPSLNDENTIENTELAKNIKEPKKEKHTKKVTVEKEETKQNKKVESKKKKEKTSKDKIKKTKKKTNKNIEYKKLSSEKVKKLNELKKISNEIKVITSEDNSIEITKQSIKGGQYLASVHCAKNDQFAYSFKDSGFGKWYEPPLKRAKYFYCTDKLIYVNPFTNKPVSWTNYVFDEYFKYHPDNKFFYREMTSRYKRFFEKDKKKNPKKYKSKPFKIIHKDENSIHIAGNFLGDLNKERYLANEHCSKFKKKYYYFEDSLLHGRFGSMLFACNNTHLAASPISGSPLIYTTGSENYSVTSNQGTTLDASQMLKFNSTNNITYLYFESSDNLMKSLELLYRAYDQNVEADKLKAQIDYNRQSKYSEQDKLSSTRSIIDTSSKEINAQIVDTSKVLSDTGRAYYQKSLPYAFKAAESSYKLIVTIKDTFEKGSQGGESFLNYANEFIGFFTIAKDIPKLASDIFKTSQLVFSGAKSKKIKDNNNLGKALDDLNLDV